MSRYRPPRQKSSPYITRHGYDSLQQELTHLWKVKRPEVTRKVSEAAAQGDRSENAEYIYGKRQLREIDSRIQFLSKRLDEVEVVERTPSQQDKVFFGAAVTLARDDGEIVQYRIVGADELDPKRNYISIDAPLARALIGKMLGDDVEIETQRNAGAGRVLEINPPPRSTLYEIVQIDYDALQ